MIYSQLDFNGQTQRKIPDTLSLAKKVFQEK